MENLDNPRPEHRELNDKLIELLLILARLKNATYIDIYPIDPGRPANGYTLDVSEKSDHIK